MRVERQAVTVISASAYYGLPCTPTTIVVDDFSYSECDGIWYQPVYSGGATTYIVVEAPYGY